MTALSTAALDLEPVAPLTGPFPQRPFLGAWADHRAADVVVVESADAALTLWDDDGVIRFAGEGDLTDYHSPLGSGAQSLVAGLRDALGPGTRLSLDSVPEDAADLLVAGLEAAGASPSAQRHEIAAVLALGSTHEEYLAGLDKKQRHEVRRKRRRFADGFGSAHLERRPDAFGRFVDMHRAAPGDKGEFMTAEMALFFEALAGVGFVLDVLSGPEGDPLAAGFGYEDDDAYYLYNSAFDPGASHASPGAVLVDLLVEQAIVKGKRRFDFLKGDEVYKFRLGAEERPLFVVEAVL